MVIQPTVQCRHPRRKMLLEPLQHWKNRSFTAVTLGAEEWQDPCMADLLDARSQSAPILTLRHSRARGVPCMTKTIFWKSCFRCLACMGQAHKRHLKHRLPCGEH